MRFNGINEKDLHVDKDVFVKAYHRSATEAVRELQAGRGDMQSTVVELFRLVDAMVQSDGRAHTQDHREPERKSGR